MTDTTPPIKRVSKHEMRRLFNEGGYYARALRGEFRIITLESRHPCLPQANQPFCTSSQMISVRDSNDDEIARAHQYLRPDISGVVYKLVARASDERQS